MNKHSQQLSMTQIANPSLSDEQLRVIVEEVERDVYRLEYPFLKDPDYPEDVLYDIFANNCGTFTGRLVELLEEKSIQVVEATSNEPKSDFHIYGLLYTKEGLRILDSSIGSIIKGVRGIVITSRAGLKAKIEDPKTVLFCSDENRVDLFKRWWGNSSRTRDHLIIPEKI